MTGRHKFDGLKMSMGTFRVSQAEARTAMMLAEMCLAKIRTPSRSSQLDVSDGLGISQPDIDEIEHRDDTP